MTRFYIWLICHNACPCALERYTGRITHGWLSYWCGRLDQKVFRV